jgi:hypothetical protein
MNAAKLEKSYRLQRVLDQLRCHPNGISSMTLIRNAQVVAPGTVVSELRHQGYDIDCKREGQVWTYKLAPYAK